MSDATNMNSGELNGTGANADLGGKTEGTNTDLSVTANAGEVLAESGNDGMQLTRLELVQRRALEALLLGKSVAESAREAGVARSTVHRWMKEGGDFANAYQEWYEMMEESSRSRLMMMTDKAASAVEKALENGDAKTAMQLLKGMGVLRGKPGV